MNAPILPSFSLMLLLSLFGSGLLYAQPLTDTEHRINDYLQDYPFTPSNAFRLATYLELKGKYDPVYEVMSVEFGGLGTMTFYERHCLLRIGQQGVYALDLRRSRTPSVQDVDALNGALERVFEQIFLMGNKGLNQHHVRFVERFLAQKNIGAFDKILLRHLLLRYGHYDSLYQRMILKTDWLPNLDFNYRGPGDRVAYEKPQSSLELKLDKNVLRGYYLRTHGTVYVEDVKRDVLYSTGEEQAPNIIAFKAFAHQMFTQNTLFLVQSEQKRLAAVKIQSEFPLELVAGELPVVERDERHLIGRRSTRPLPRGYIKESEPDRYPPHHWVPMMLGLLRDKGISIADPDILPYFIDEPYFPFIYKLLSHAERMSVDRYLKWHDRRTPTQEGM